VRPKDPSQQDICQFHKSFECISQPSFDVHGKPPDTFVADDVYAKARENLPKYRSVSDFIVGYGKPRNEHDENWGIRVILY
jgi:hypothetical protein